MYTRTKKVLAFLLAALFALTLFVGCNNKENPGRVDDEPDETMTYLDALPAQYDMKGEKIRFWANANSAQSLDVEELEGDLVKTAVYERNNILERRFNVELVVKSYTNSSLSDIIRTAILSDTDDFDVCCIYQYHDVRLAQEGLLLNLANQDNLDFSQEYWGTEMIDGMSYKNAKYWCTGDIFQNYIGGMYVTFLNKQVWENYYPGQDYYQLVSNGEWTLEKVDELCAKIYEDVNRNTERDLEDTYGMYINSWTEVPDAFIYATGMTFTSRDSLDTPMLDINMENMNTVHRKLKKLFFNNDGVMMKGDERGWELLFERFAQDKALLMMTNLFYASNPTLRDMESDYAILPMPKLDEEQKNYMTILHDGTSLMGIPTTNRRVNETTMVLEALASESYRTVTPVYYDLALKFKYQRDDAAGAMIDMIRDGVTGDFGYYYAIGSGTDKAWTSISYVLRSIYQNEYTPIVSTLKQYNNLWTSDLEALLTEMEANSYS